MYDYLIVGAGYSGCVLAERLASQLGKKVIIVERRDHIAGNAYDYYDDRGILVHKYGPHVFHTNSKKVWDYVNEFTEWKRYEHKVLASVDGKRIPVPFNLNSLHMIYPDGLADRLERQLMEKYGLNTKTPIMKMIEEPDGELKALAKLIYEKVFYNYTLKQWGLKPEQLAPSVMARVPVSISRDDRYFQDTYQAMPINGYTEMFRKILAHKNISIQLNTDYKDVIDSVKFDRMIYTGPIDLFFDYLHGELPYRSLRFEMKSFETERFQEAPSVNYPNENEYTRITEFKYLTGQNSNVTTVAFEYPRPHITRVTEPYYPIPREENEILFNGYRREVEKLNGVVTFVGRLAEYRYYNMDQVVAAALTTFEKIAGRSDG